MSDETIKNPNLYKYRIGNSWYTFDKTVLEPEDLRVFELADWKDKLKIITIYKDLKEHDDDDVVILKTKTESPKKDARRRNYLEQKVALEKEIGQLNELQNQELKNATSEEEIDKINKRYESQINAINKKLDSLDSSFSDVITVKRIDAPDLTKTNKILTSAKNAVEEAKKIVKDLGTSLQQNDYNKIENKINKVINSTTQKEFFDNTKDVKVVVKDLEKKATQQSQKQQLNELNKTIKDFEKIASDEQTNFIIEKVNNDQLASETFLDKYDEVKQDIPVDVLTDEEIKTLNKYSDALELVKGATQYLPDRIAFNKNFANLIMLYIDAKKAASRFKFDIYDDEKPTNLNSVKVKKPYSIVDLLNQFPIYYVPNTSKIYIYKLKSLGGRPPTYKLEILREDGYSLSYLNTDLVENTYKTISEIVDSKGSGILGLTTNKQVKKDFDFINERINKIIERQDKILDKLEQTLTLFSKTQTNTPDYSKNIKQPVYEKPVIKEESNETDKPRMSYFQDIIERPRLKHIEPVKQPPELTDLQKTFMKRREQMGYTDDDTETDDEDWGDGLKLESLQGGLLEELADDLKRYGLALSLAPDEKAYFLNVYEKGKTRKNKGKGSGVAEADTLVKSVNEDTEYKDLKKLYESLY